MYRKYYYYHSLSLTTESFEGTNETDLTSYLKLCDIVEVMRLNFFSSVPTTNLNLMSLVKLAHTNRHSHAYTFQKKSQVVIKAHEKNTSSYVRFLSGGYVRESIWQIIEFIILHLFL
jgi:hypothetical protein